jgi:hypothetical protein
VQAAVRPEDGDVRDVATRPPLPGHVGEATEDQPVLHGVVIRVAPARRADAGLAAEGVDDEARVLAERQQSGGMVIGAGLDRGVVGEGAVALGDVHAEPEVGWRDEAGGESGQELAELADLAAAGRAEQQQRTRIEIGHASG